MPSTLSVVVPNYNHAAYLPRALDAVLSQSFAPQEVLVIDDGSTDDSLDVIASYVRRDSRVRMIRNSANRGVIWTFNRGMQLAQGDYVYGAGADDQVLPEFFSRAMRLAAENPQAGLVCGFPSHVVVDERGRETFHVERMDWSDRPCFLSPRDLAARFLAGNADGTVSRVYSPSAICKRSSLLAAGGYLTELRWISDWFVNHVIALREGIGFIPDTLALFYKRPGGYSQPARDDDSGRGTGCPEVNHYLLQLLRSPAYRDVLTPFLASGLVTPSPVVRRYMQAELEEAQQYVAGLAGALSRSEDRGVKTVS